MYNDATLIQGLFTMDKKVVGEKQMSEEPENTNSCSIEDMLAAGVEPHSQTVEAEFDCVATPEDTDTTTTETEDGLKKAIPVWAKIMIVAIAALVILFAFVWENVYTGSPDEEVEIVPKRSHGEVQDELDELDWVIPGILPENEYSRPGTLISSVNAIVIHYIGNPGTSAEQNRNYFANLGFTGETHASSNFIIGLDGEVIQCVPVDEIAYASGERNADTLSIELCHPDDTGQFTDETYASALRLTAWLCERYGLTADDLLRHFDVTGKECPRYFVLNEDEWEAFKDNVGIMLDS